MRLALRDLFLDNRLFQALAVLVALFVAGYLFPIAALVAEAGLVALTTVTLIDIALLFAGGERLAARRELPGRLSNGDANPVSIFLRSRYGFPVRATVIDELPSQLQRRDSGTTVALTPGGEMRLRYSVRPTERGEYDFGRILAYVRSPLGLARRRYAFPEARTVPVYPSYIQMRHYELLAASNRLTEAGIKRIRRIGHTMEFDHIRPWVQGDDYRTVNWKATARRHEPMVNHYQDERSQPVYSLINMGRVMKMPFAGLTLLDYAINAALVLSNIAIGKQDRAGLVTFADMVHTIVPADRRPTQMARILEALYRQRSGFLEADYGALTATVLRQVRQRSLFLLFTNFETLTALHRQMPYLRPLAARHLLVVIFFENTELHRLYSEPAGSLEGIYRTTIAERFAYEKRQIVRELQQAGMHAVLTAPERLTVGTINQYLELKARGMI